MQSEHQSKGLFWGDLATAGEGFTMLLLSLIVVFVFCQQNLDSPNISQIGRGFGLTGLQIDARIGGEAFIWQMVVASLALMIFGYLADLTDRKVLLFFAITTGAAAYFAASLARTADQFIFLKALGGVGIGGIVPVIFSILGDVFTARTRALASGIFMAVANSGAGVGFILGGLVGAEDAFGWRASFMVQSLILLGLAALFLAFGRLPTRGAADVRSILPAGMAEYQGRIHFSDLRRILAIRTNLIFILACVISTIPFGYFQRFMVDFFARDIGMGAGGGTLIILVVLSGALLGDLLGGLFGDMLHRRDRRGPPLLASGALLGGSILFIIFFGYPYPTHPSWGALIFPIIVGFCATALVEIPALVSKAIMLDVNIPENRGTIAALIRITGQIGFGLGAFISIFGPRLAVLMHMVPSRLSNFKLAVLIWIPVAFVWLIVVHTAPRDEQQVEAYLREIISCGTGQRGERGRHGYRE